MVVLIWFQTSHQSFKRTLIFRKRIFQREEQESMPMDIMILMLIVEINHDSISHANSKLRSIANLHANLETLKNLHKQFTFFYKNHMYILYCKNVEYMQKKYKNFKPSTCLSINVAELRYVPTVIV